VSTTCWAFTPPHLSLSSHLDEGLGPAGGAKVQQGSNVVLLQARLTKHEARPARGVLGGRHNLQQSVGAAHER
jgi:hypothetical protein